MKTATPSWIKKTVRSGHDSALSDSPIDYHSWEWRKFSDANKKENPMCAECMRNGKYKFGRTTDHIIPIRMGGALWDDRNIQTLCKSCDDEKRNKESRGEIPAYTGEYGHYIPSDVV